MAFLLSVFTVYMYVQYHTSASEYTSVGDKHWILWVLQSRIVTGAGIYTGVKSLLAIQNK